MTVPLAQCSFVALVRSLNQESHKGGGNDNQVCGKVIEKKSLIQLENWQVTWGTSEVFMG